jgi:hypothetical protein
MLVVYQPTAVEAQDHCAFGELAIGRAWGNPGDRVEVDILGGVGCDVTGFILAIGHDSNRLSVVDAVAGEFLVEHAGSELYFQVTAENDEGYAVVGCIFDFSFPLTVPPTAIPPGTVLATLTYEILPDAPLGTTPLLNRTRTYGEVNPVSNIYSGKPGESPVEPHLVDGGILVHDGSQVLFRRGDANADGEMDLSDGIFILGYLFTGGAPPDCLRAADVNGSQEVDLSDAIYLLRHLFLGGDEPPEPFPACGTAPGEDDLSCDAYPPCS